MPVATAQAEQCPICGQHQFEPFFEVHDVPTQDGMLWPSRAAALAAPTGNMQLAFCQDCGYIGNTWFEPEKIRYDQEYSFSLNFSPTFRDFMTDVATRLIERYQIRNKTVLEIGCGEGDFLRLICELGQNCGIGVDPITTSHLERVGGKPVTFIQDRYTERYADYDVDLICCRQALDQLPQPKAMIELVRRNLGNRQGVVYMEVPNAASIFEDLSIRNIMYEKSSWFTLGSLARMFELSGFNLVALEPCFNRGEYIGIEAVPATEAMRPAAQDRASLENFARAIAAFGAKHAAKISGWREQLTTIQQRGQRAIAWGAGAGAISFFSLLKVQEEVPFVVDIHPKRQGKFLPLTGQQVVPPEFLHHHKMDVVIITNASFECEIKQQIAQMGLAPDFWVL